MGSVSDPAVASMSTEEKVGQLVMAGFEGREPDDHIGRLVGERALGGVLYFDRNAESPEQVAALSSSLRDIAAEHGRPPPLIAVDQEGGPVARFRWGSELPAQMALGATADRGLARRAGRAVGRQLRALEVDLNLAPVLDVNVDPANPVIGVRSFGEDPDLVADLGGALAAGLGAAGTLACGKHFPGHGDTKRDSHEALPVLDHGLDRLRRVEFRPFRRAVRNGVPAVMTAHVALPAVTGDRTPATVAPAVVTGVLRDELGHDGLVLTDCMEMAAIADGIGSTEGAVRAIGAGCDVVTVSHSPSTQHAVLDRLLAAVESGRLPERRIDRSVERILAVKRDRGGDRREPGTVASTLKNCRDVARSVARRGVTGYGRSDGTLPLAPGAEAAVWTVAPDREQAAPGPRIAGHLRTHGIEAEARTVEPEAPPDRADGATVVVCAGSSPEDGVARLVERLAADDTSVVGMVCGSPYAARAFPEAPVVITYDATPASLEAGAAVLAGRAAADGRLPVTIPGRTG